MVYNRYDQFTVGYLIECVQRIALLRTSKEYRKLTGAKKTGADKDLSEMRQSIMSRLIHQDRTQPLFFPTGCYILYQKQSQPVDFDDFDTVSIPPRNGKVIAHEKDKVLIKLEGDKYNIKVDPQDLKIKFIRSDTI